MNPIIVPLVVASLFLIVKLMEEYYTKRSIEAGIKFIVRDSIIVFLCAMFVNIGLIAFESHFVNIMNMITQTKTQTVEGATEIFTDNPGF